MIEILYAFTQIIIEMLPVSSSGHVLLLTSVLKRIGVDASAIPVWYDHFLHGPMLVLVALYFRQAWFLPIKTLIRGWWSNNHYWKRLAGVIGKIVLFVGCADTVTACMYLTFKQALDASGISVSPIAVVIGMSLTAGLLFSTFWLPSSVTGKFSWQTSLVLGFVQGCAFFPGLSRFGSTYVAARWLGISHRRALQSSFALFVPFVIIAFIFHGVPGALQHGDVIASVLLPCIVASVLAYAVFVWIDWLAARGKWYWLGWYMFLPIGLLFVII